MQKTERWISEMEIGVAEPILSTLKNNVSKDSFSHSTLPSTFFETIQIWLASQYHWKVEKDWLVYCRGTLTALSMLIPRFSKPGDTIIIQSPIYHLFNQLIELNNRVVVENKLLLKNNHYTIDFADLEKQCVQGAKMLIFSNPHNPVGRVWKEDELKKVAEICLKYKTLLISDETYSDLVYSGYRHIPIATLSEAIANNSITSCSPNKGFNLSGLQTAYLVIPNQELRNQYIQEQKRLDLSFPPALGTVALEAAYTLGKPWLHETLKYFEKNIQLVAEQLRNHFPEIQMIQPEATYILWLDCRAMQMDRESLHHFFQFDANVSVGLGYRFGAAGEGFVRLNISCSREKLQAVLERLITAKSR